MRLEAVLAHYLGNTLFRTEALCIDLGHQSLAVLIKKKLLYLLGLTAM